MCTACGSNAFLAELGMCARQTRFKRARGRTSLGAEKWLDTPLHAGTAAAVAALRASGFSIAAAQVLYSSGLLPNHTGMFTETLTGQ